MRIHILTLYKGERRWVSGGDDDDDNDDNEDVHEDVNVKLNNESLLLLLLD
jgi:hypothetical protein